MRFLVMNYLAESEKCCIFAGEREECVAESRRERIDREIAKWYGMILFGSRLIFGEDSDWSR